MKTRHSARSCRRACAPSLSTWTRTTVVGGLVVAGDRVDVIADLRRRRDRGHVRANAAAGRRSAGGRAGSAEADRAPRQGRQPDRDRLGSEVWRHDRTTPTRTKTRDTVTLAVAPDDAPLLALAQEEGTVWLALRGIGDSETPFFGPVSIAADASRQQQTNIRRNGPPGGVGTRGKDTISAHRRHRHPGALRGEAGREGLRPDHRRRVRLRHGGGVDGAGAAARRHLRRRHASRWSGRCRPSRRCRA